MREVFGVGLYNGYMYTNLMTQRLASASTSVHVLLASSRAPRTNENAVSAAFIPYSCAQIAKVEYH